MAAAELDIKDYFVEDSDVCTENELAEIFPLRYKECKNVLLSGSKNHQTFVKMAVSTNEESLSIGSKTGDIKCFDGSNGSLVDSFKGHEKEITGMQYCPNNINLLYSSSSDCTIKLRDLRSNKFEHTYEHKSESSKVLPFTCLDINNTGEFLCSGTPFIEDEAYLLFWDVRMQHKLLGCYSDSHSDDVTAVQFHPRKRSEISSAAMDNLINIFDISKSSEFDAYIQCINFETTPDVIIWDKHTDHATKLFGINYPQIIQYWDIDGTTPSVDLKPKIYCKAMKRSVPDQCHFISLNYNNSLDPLLMFSSNLGHTSHANACIRTLKFSREKKKLSPHATLDLQESKMVDVCDSIFLPGSEVFVTLESSRLRYWSQQKQKRSLAEESTAETMSSNLKRQKL